MKSSIRGIQTRYKYLIFGFIITTSLFLILRPMIMLNEENTFKLPMKLGEINPSKEAYITLVTNDGPYITGAIVLGRSLKEMMNSRNSSRRDMICMVTQGVGSESKRLLVEEGGWEVLDVPNVENPYVKEINENRFHGTFSKIHIWKMIQYSTLLYLDADCIVLHPIDELFSCHHFCALPNELDRGYFRFNSGVMAFNPSLDMYNMLTLSLKSPSLFPSFDHADQGFLNAFFYWDCKSLFPSNYTSIVNQYSILDKQFLDNLEPSNEHTYCDPPPFPGYYGIERCLSLDEIYNYRVKNLWHWYNTLFAQKKVKVVQYIGDFKPWDCTQSHDGLSWFHKLLCYQKIYRVYSMVMAGDTSLLRNKNEIY